jgi:2-polyprenyl-3-methyl-5-hydroxy-6-metoxy-1,4-benzoquinol methylase
MAAEHLFHVPPKGALESSGAEDPLPCYYRPATGWLYRYRIELLLRLLPPGSLGRVLEVGYGSGILIPSLINRATEYVGLDFASDPEQVRQGLRRCGVDKDVQLHREDFTTAAVGSFDLIIAVSIFEHIHDVSTLVQAIAQHLNPGGMLLVGMPRVDKVMSKLFCLIGENNIDGKHVTSYRVFKRHAEPLLELVAETDMFPMLPSALALYHCALLRKRG